jgi:uncharacterized surface protein with fasciclin (FAS1) repeats
MTSRVVRWLGVAVPVVALSFGGWAVAQEPPKKEPPKAEPKKVEPPKPADDKKVEPKAEKDILAAAAEAKLTTFVELVKLAGLDEELKGTGPFTAFAPTDDAFAKLPNFADLKKPEKKAELKNILLYHVTKGKLMAADLGKAKDPIKTLLPKGELTVTTKDGKTMVNGKATVTKEYVGKNGVVQAIDTVLTPPAADKPEVKKPEAKPEEKKPAEPKKP